ncbi:DEAD/DEAH box helicase [Helicobacter muridarum]|uniref:DEAD/DEAH box helicase n=1 Tax=Helicobacter muridarum TaxID=216 RepID=A0A099U0M0_9HELI|nr:PBECR2 nuclease fold domain-containing protein [Helicobacter muridarum]TLD98493.1 DEAD/DEAH box helicase [Helicobacter muridarum]STQ85765.1 helicase, Snf2 family [Helicobacter muridarum]
MSAKLLCLDKLQKLLLEKYPQKHTSKDIYQILRSKGYTQIKQGDKLIDISGPKPKDVINQDILFTDKTGKTRILTKETQEQWLKTFGLDNLDQSYIPKHSQEIKQALGDKEIRLTKGSLLKLVERDREKYLPQIKETLDSPEMVIKDIDNMLILAKQIEDKQYFTSVNLETQDYFVVISNAPKKQNILKNKVENGAKIIYQSPNAKSIFYTDTLLQTGKSPANKIDNPHSTTNAIHLQDTASAKLAYNQNIKALEALDSILQSNQNKILDELTPQQRDVLSNFRGFGKASNELIDIIKAKDSRYTHLQQLLESLSKNIKSNSILNNEITIAQLLRNSNDAYFTPTPIIESMVNLVKSLGLKKDSNILEPSAGSGRFLGFLPQDNNIIAVELDSISAAIAKTLYPKHIIENAPFQSAKLANKLKYDVVIGNPPYGNTKIQGKSIHNYFMLEGIQKLRPNGISIQIVTHNFMDAKDSSTRQAIAKIAKFLGGVRLPNTAFKDAKVTTDILVFRKFDNGEEYVQSSLTDSFINSSPYKEATLSNYFANNPKHILGELTTIKDAFGNMQIATKDNGVYNPSNLNLQSYIQKDGLELKTPNGYNDMKQYHKSYYEEGYQERAQKDTQYYTNQLKELTDWREESIAKRVKQYEEQIPKIQQLKNALQKLHNAERDLDSNDNYVEVLRKAVNEKYQNLLGSNKSFRNINNRINDTFKAFSLLDDSSFEIFALETGPIIKELKSGKKVVIGSQKAQILNERVNYPYVRPQSANSLDDALHISLNEYGKIDYERISELLGITQKQAQKQLLDNKYMYIDIEGNLIDKDKFLSGNVKEKLKDFYDENGNVRLSKDKTIANYQTQALQDLQNVIPPDIEIPYIKIPLGANWLSKEITDGFLQDILDIKAQTSYTRGLGWSVDIINPEASSRSDLIIQTSKAFAENTGISHINAINYLEDMFNNKTLSVQASRTIGDKVKIFKDPSSSLALENLKKQLTKEFKDYIISNDSFAIKAQKEYNDIFNTTVLRKYDGSHLSLIGSNKDIILRTHQKNAVFRILSQSNTLLAHEVGTGKTYTMIASAIEAKRLGLIQNSMIVMPNHIATQLASEARKLYPQARIKVVQAISKKDKNIQLAQIKNNDYDLVITTYTAFENMNVRPEAFKQYYEQEISQLEKILSNLQQDPNTPKRKIKAVANKIAKIQEKITKYIQDLKKDDVSVFYEDLGIDMLLFDEAHYLKSLPIHTSQINVRGINTQTSNRAFDAYLKIQNGSENSKVVFATGTPVTNFISDIYTMQRFLNFKGLREKGIDNFDEWSKMFANASTEYELKATGEYKPTTRMRDFSNLPELKMDYFSFTDSVSKEDMKKDLIERGIKNIEPEVERINIMLDKDKDQEEYAKHIIARTKELQDNPQLAYQKGGDNHLKIMNDANKASLDMRLINPNLQRNQNGKIARAANAIMQNYNMYNEHKGTQLVFLDTSIPKKKMSDKKLAQTKQEIEKITNILENENLSSEMADRYTTRLENLQEALARHEANFSAYSDLKELLVEKGIKENEIAFVHDYDGKEGTARSKGMLSQKINSGEIRVLIGSTGKMGAGSNFQERLVALHHLDLNWTPANMEQREGRIIRQGNILWDNYNIKPKIYTYITKEMTDSVMLQVLQRKQKIIKEISSLNFATRELEDTSEDNLYGLLQAASSPYSEQIMQTFNLEKEIDLLSNMIGSNEVIKSLNAKKIQRSQNYIERLQQQLSMIGDFKERIGNNTTYSLGNTTIDLDKKANAKQNKAQKTKYKNDILSSKDTANFIMLDRLHDFERTNDKILDLGVFRGLRLFAKKDIQSSIYLNLGDDIKHSFEVTTLLFKEIMYRNPDIVQRLNNFINRVKNDSLKYGLQGKLTQEKEALSKAKKALELANKADLSNARKELNNKQAELAELNVFLNKASDREIELVESIYGEEYKDILQKKYDY